MEKVLEPFFGQNYLATHERLAKHGGLFGRFVLKELGATPLAGLVEHSASLSSMNLLRAALLVRRLPEAIKRVRQERHDRKAWQELERCLIETSAASSGFNIVQIGAYDGLTNDRLRPLLLKYRWKALLVEPLADVSDKLAENYSGHPNVAIARRAVVASDGPVEMFRVDPRSNAPGYAQLMSSTKQSHINSFPHLTDDDVITETVPGVRLKTLYEQFGITDPSLLIIDAEGCDFEILDQITSGDVPSPQFLVFEHDHMTETQLQQTIDSLADRDYTSQILAHDVMCFR